MRREGECIDGQGAKVGAADFLTGIPLFEGLPPAEIDRLRAVLRPAAFDAGAVIVRQGHPADSAFLLETGAADVLTTLPGGGTAAVATLGPGSTLGEMALLDSGVRSATVVAQAPVSGYWMDRDSFRMLLAHSSPAMLAVQHRITLSLCGRLRELNAKIAADGSSIEAPDAFAADEEAGVQRGASSFDWRAFLPLLPAFRRFHAEDIDALTARARALELARGALLFRQGDAAAACWIIVRGAVELSLAANGRRRRIGVLGPGRLCGVVSLIERRSHSMTAVAREDALLLEVAGSDFNDLYGAGSRLAARLRDAMNRELLQALARTNNHLTRLISQAHIRGGSVHMRRAEELQRAMGKQECSPA